MYAIKFINCGLLRRQCVRFHMTRVTCLLVAAQTHFLLAKAEKNGNLSHGPSLSIALMTIAPTVSCVLNQHLVSDTNDISLSMLNALVRGYFQLENRA